MIRILLFCLLSLLSSPGLLLARDVFFYHNDNVGTPVAMTDSSGKVVWRAHDKPFGEEFQTTEAPEHNSRRFIGKEKDKETGLVYIGARYLDPASGRFLQPDPVGPVDPMTGKVNVEMLANPQRLNRYVYGLNNPYRYIDPDGESPVLVLGLIGAAASYLSAPDVANAPESSSAPTFKSNGGYSIAAGAAGGVGAGKVAQAVTAAKIAETTPGGRTLTDHAIKRMTNPPNGRASMTASEVDEVLDTANKIRKISVHPKGNTITVQNTSMPGKPQVVVDAKTGQRVITVIKREHK